MREQYPQAAPNKVYVLMRLPNIGIIDAACHSADIPSAVGGYVYQCRLFVFDGVTESTVEYRNTGSVTSCTFTAVDLNLTEMALLTGLTANATELNTLDNQTLTTPAGAGATGGTGTIYKNSAWKNGDIIYTRILMDLTGLGSSTTDGDIIGTGTANAHIGQVTAAQNGTILALRMTCLEVPATGADDIDLFYATVATGKFDDAMSGITGQTSLISSGGAWAANTQKLPTVDVPANAYLYLVNGEAGTAGTYTAGKFLIEMWGY